MANYTQFAVPGLMTPHAPNFKKNIIANEAGDIIMLLHSGVATDCVHYCLIVGGNRREGVVKDPSYPFVNGMDGREMDKNKFNKAPDFAYKTTDFVGDKLNAFTTNRLGEVGDESRSETFCDGIGSIVGIDATGIVESSVLAGVVAECTDLSLDDIVINRRA